MKDNSLDGHRGKVAVSDTSRVTTAGGSVKCDLKTSVTSAASDGAATTNFDDDYNEWELGIGDLIIDLDADIEKTNTNHHHHHHQNGTVVGNSPGASTAVSPSSVGAASFAFLGSQSCTPAMSNSKSSRLISGTNNSGSAGSTTGGTSVSSNSTGGTAGAVEHQATVDKGLKMKIKRKTVGSKYSEAKHEIVQSDTKSVPAHPLCENMSSSNSAGGQNSVPSSETKSKHSSSKGRTSSHRDKKEKNRDKDKSANTKAATSSAEVNGAMNVMSPSLKITNSGVSMSALTPSSGANTITQNGSIMPSLPQTSTSSRSVPTSSCNSNCSSSNSNSSTSSNSATSSAASAVQETAQANCPTPSSCSPPMPNLTLKLENKFAVGQPTVVVKQEDRLSPPLKKIKVEDTEIKVDTACSPVPPEMKDTSTCTSVGTITEPDCLGPCEPGTSVMLEGIVWQETEGGVLVVNVTWRGKTYVGTLLDCTKHDWAPPRFCESPTSDVDSKTSKGRGKRGRGSNNNTADVNAYNDARNCVQSKLRNGKGRRTTVNSSNSSAGFTVPSSPAKSDNGVPTNNKRKGRPSEGEVSTPQVDAKSSKRSRSQSRGTPTPNSTSAAEFSQPSSPVLIECPEPNCSKKYKHINGLRYHQTHAHNGLDGGKLEDSNSEDIKDATNSSDNEESIQESMSVPPSPAMSFRNSASPHPTNGRSLQGENTSSLSCSSLPESDPYSLTPDLSTLASVAISDSKSTQKSELLSKTAPSPLPVTPQEILPAVSSEASKTSSLLPAVTYSASQCPSSPISVPPAISTESNNNVPVPAATTTSVIHSPAAMDSSVVSPSVTVSIPTSHVVLSQGITVGGNSVTTTTHTTSTAVCHNTASVVSRGNLAPASTSTTSFVSIPPPVTSTTSLCSSPVASVGDKSKIKQDKLEKYKPKSPLATTPAIRPIVPAPSPQLIALSTNIPVSHPNISPGSHNLVTSSLKPIQPKPTILGEPPTISPALESLKKEKSKHKKKSKDKEKKAPVQMSPAPVRHASSHGGEECEAMDITPYPNLEAVPSTRDPLSTSVPIPSAPHSSMSPLPNQPKPQSDSLDMSVADDNMNENIQSPAYSDISDANDTAPVLESEVPSGKEKEDKVGKSTPDTPQSPAANISAYGMYPYYSQPPYLLPSVSPQNSVPGPQMPGVSDKPDSSKKLEQERIKENRPWSNSSGEIARERQNISEHDSSEKKTMREEGASSSSVIPSPSSSAAIQEYPMQQHYPYSYGYVQGYQYSVEPSYHMQLLDTDPHYKQQYKQYIEEQQRLYKEQQHQQQHQQQHHHHHQQHSQQQHHSHSQQHHSSHQSKSHHQSSSVKDERGRDKERAIPEKMSNSTMVIDHSGKQQHSSLSLVVNKEHDAPRDPEARPPSLPAQARVDNTTPSSASAAAALKEKQNENHQILKENIELKSQMDASKNKVNQYEMAMLYERHRNDVQRYYIFQERLMEQQQHHQQHKDSEQQQHHHHMSQHPSSLSSSLKSHKDDVVALSSSQSKPNHYSEGSRSSVISPPKSDHIKCSSTQPNSTSSPKTTVREQQPVSIPKDYGSSSGMSSSAKKESSSSSSKAPAERLDSSAREDKCKSDKNKVEVKVEPEGQKPTMETTGPPPPPTNSYAYLHPSYLPPAPPHFPHMPFEAAHAVYRGGINPMLMSSPHYSNSPYVHQLRYPGPAACDLPAPSQPVDPLSNKLHAPGPGKALDLLHQVSQHYTTHKIHELQEHALMSPTPTSTPSSTPSTSASASNKVSSTEPVMTVAKVEAGATRDSSRSPPTQRHLHTHHHTHVGVGYPIYDPYGVAQQHWKQSQNQRRVPYRFTR